MNADYILRAAGVRDEDKAAVIRRAARLAEHDQPDGAVVYVPLGEGYAIEKAMPGHLRAMRKLTE